MLLAILNCTKNASLPSCLGFETSKLSLLRKLWGACESKKCVSLNRTVTDGKTEIVLKEVDIANLNSYHTKGADLELTT